METGQEILDILDGDLSVCWDVVGEWGKYLEDKSTGGFDYEGNSPQKKSVIVSAITRILSEQDFELMAKSSRVSVEKVVNQLRSSLVFSLGLIPDEKDYLASKDLIDRVQSINKD